jgi:transposase
MAMTKDIELVSQVIGVDLGDRYSQLCVLDMDGAVAEESRVPTTEAAFTRRFVGQARSRVVLETGTHANWVHDLLTQAGHEVVVANARKVRAISANERKSDTVDAWMLARLGRADVSLLCPVKVRAEETRQDLTLMRARAALVVSRTMLVNCARGLAKAAGHKLPSSSAASFHKQELHETLRAALAPMLELLAQTTGKIAAYDKAIDQLCEERYVETKLLRQIKGVGPLTSLCFVLTIGDPTRFKHARDVGAYVGLVPRRDQSGGKDPQLRISKTGDPMLRTLLVQSAHHILGPFGVDSDVRRFGLKLAQRGGKNAKKRAVVATARKLSVLLMALLRSAEVYEPLRNQARAKAS